MIRTMKYTLLRMIKKYYPPLWYFLEYRKAAERMGDSSRIRDEAFAKLIAGSDKKSCLQIGVRDAKYGMLWTSVDLYHRDAAIDYNYDIQDLKFPNESFDIVVCVAILEHVEDPHKAIEEMRRVMKKGAHIWVEVPLNQPYHPSPNDYWRVTVPGMKLWMKDFIELECGFFKINGSSIYNGVFFHGCKP